MAPMDNHGVIQRKPREREGRHRARIGLFLFPLELDGGISLWSSVYMVVYTQAWTSGITTPGSEGPGRGMTV